MPSDTELREYLALLRERRRHTKLQVFQNYLEEIKTRDTRLNEATFSDANANSLRAAILAANAFR
jgi:hypothetical protein